MKTLWQQVYGLGRKRLDYEYELVSGKVNFLSYQRGEADQFYYKYQYDAENRLREAWSGTLALVKPFGGSQLLNGKMDAAYNYYLHGPLARMELGDQTGKVQGLDYAYTLQGWLKGVNGQELDATKEIGKDGSAVSTIAKDVMGYSLGYFAGDYQPIGTNAPAFALQYQRQGQDITGHNLYNGNISNTTVAISKFRGGDPVGYTYKYDQLNRLTRMRQHQLAAGASTWNASSITDSLKEDISYDGNGNILSYLRNGNGQNKPLAMDQLSYQYDRDYEGRLLSNQLRQVKDAVGKDNYDQDIDSQGSENYHYDQIGNLIADRQERIGRIHWTVYGKIKSIEKTDGTVIGYTYDPSGNRATKSVNGQMTWYIRDAQGNTLGVYDNDSCRINWREQQLYGSSRLGMWKPNVNLNAQTGSAVWDTTGNRFFELSNHLGNVLAVISDKRTLKEDGTYEADVVSAQDYYPFGMIQPGRSFSSDSYRYGFNGKENDNEVKGRTGSQQDYGMRIYDPRLGRFLSVDPITSQYPSLTPYQFASNSPLANIDLDGLEANLAIAGKGGASTAYTKQDINAFSSRANRLKQFGFASVAVNNGQMLIKALKSATKTEGSISAIVSYAHGGANGIYLDSDLGFYAGSEGLGNIQKVSQLINSGDIKFTKNAVWIFASCNAGNSTEVGDYNIAKNAAKTLNITTIGARGFVSPVIKDGKETGELSVGEYHDQSYDRMGFIKFTPITTKKIIPYTILGFKIPWIEGKTVTETTIKEEYLGDKINPTNYVPKKN